MPSSLLLGLTYAFAAAVQPGPFQAYLISQTLSHGLRRTVPAAFAPLLSDGPIIALTLFLLSRMPAWLLQSLRLGGGLFLLYLAAGTFKAWRDYGKESALRPPAGGQTLLKAALVNLLNPAPYLAWSLVMGPLLLEAWRVSPANGLALLAGFYGVLILGLLGIMLLFSAAGSLGPRLTRLLVGLSALGLAAFGLYQLWQGAAAFWRPG